MLETLFLIVICHLIGDYVLQIDFIAKTKGENWYHLFVHSALYVVPFYFAFGWGMNGFELGLLLGSHFLIDASKARWNKISYFCDQCWHYTIAILLFGIV